jgi:hypothetical protein
MWEGWTCEALVPENTFWYLIDFAWAQGSWRYKKIQETPGDIMVDDINMERKTIRRVEDTSRGNAGNFLGS